MKIAVLAWGSLIWDPRELKIESGSWKDDGPCLPIEFARISQDGHLTLVIYKGAGDVEVLWNTMTIDSINEARKNLMAREGSRCIDIIGYCEVENDKNQHGETNICERIRTWAKEKKLDAVHLVYSGFVNTMRQEARMEVLLPIGRNTLEEVSISEHSWDYRYEPSPVAVLEYLVRRYLESVVYQALSENMASEQAARMVAMKAATDNAGNAIKELRLIYNKSRQAAITTELSEIVAGAAAV